jgi:carboxyl-terminal processing protease
MRPILLAVLSVVLVHCGGSGGGNGGASWRQLAAKCATPRSGTDPFTGRAYPDQKGTLDDEKTWLRAWTDDTYLWYREVPALDPAAYATALAYFNALKTSAMTASGKPKDQFHFTFDTAQWEQLSQASVEVGYGITLAALSRKPPRQYVIAYVELGSPADTKVVRGAQIMKVDGADLVNATDPASINTLNAGLFPATVSESHVFDVMDYGQTSTHQVTLVSASVTSAPVPPTLVHTISTTTGPVGYIFFNDHTAPAEKGLSDAISQLKQANVTDLVLDIRYNGGGYLDIASELAYMIAGAGRTAGQTFDRVQFNDKHPTTNPVTGQALSPTPFFSTAQGFSLGSGTSLPSLGLGRVYVLTGSGTCSASEAVLNGLAGVNVQVFQIGATTCGKPYGFYPADNCGTTYFSIQFQGVNAKGYGDYADGFTPGATTTAGFPGCSVSDDFGHALGDAAEVRLATALSYRASGSCTGVAMTRALVSGGLSGDGEILKPIWRKNRIFRR